MLPSCPIVVLDSGLGGLTVVRALRAALPLEHILYFGDTARLPYGNKTAGTVSSFVNQIIEYLRVHNPKHVVIACNTATALGLSAARAAFPDLIITGVIDPGARAAVEAAGANPTPIIGILATEATVKSKAYEQAILRRRTRVRILLQPAPLLVPIIEEGRAKTDPLVRLALMQYLDPMIHRDVEVVLLGCTHYPVFRDVIQEITGPGIGVIDSAQRCAEDVANRLRAGGLFNRQVPSGGQGSLRCFVTDDPARFQRLAPRFLGTQIEEPSLVSPEELYHLKRPVMVRLSVPA